VNVIILVSGYRLPRAILWGCPLIAALLTGCGGEDVQVYRVAKDTSTKAENGAQHNHAAAGSTRSGPTLDWKLPQDWEETPASEMRFASFRVKGPDGKTADLGVFPGIAGGDLENVNRWRGQVGQAPITEEERAKAAIPVTIDGQPAQVYEIAGENPGSGDKTRILAGILRKDGTPWFFKMIGQDDIVAAQKTAFIDWLKSLRFGESVTPGLPPSHPPINAGVAPMQSASTSSASAEGKPVWQVPSGWQEAPGGQFLVAKFNISGPDNSQAAVNVSMSAGEGGGLAGNVNRWRRQVGLPDLADAEIQKLVTLVDLPGGKASLVELVGTDPKSGQKTRLVGGMVPRGNQTWFYKLMGSEQIVEREKANFQNFIKTAKYPDA
jgi:hypothetical protein